MKSYNKKYRYYKIFKDINETIIKRYNILISLILFLMLILIGSLFYVQILRKDYYENRIKVLTKNIVYGTTAPRGRIYDRNGNVIVDNKTIKVIYYKKEDGVTDLEEIELAKLLSEKLSVECNNVSDTMLKTFWIKENKEEADKKITKEELKLLKERKITNDDIFNYKLERVTLEEIKEIDKETAYIYYLMNKGYSYDEKIIKKYATDLEYAFIGENYSILKGVNTRLDWERSYPYGNTFKSILGTVSTSETGIPYELKGYYLSKGYNLNDQVGTSYLELEYDHYLKGIKNKYEIVDGKYKLLEEGKRGNDIYLSIDINLQQEVEKIIEKELLIAKREYNTEYFNKAFVIITEPNTGEILAMAGKQIVKDGNSYKIYDYTPGVVTTTVVAGSIVKGASQLVGYNTGNLKIGEVRNDACIKIAATKEKCSVYYMGNIDDVQALARSSNTYQFNTAIKVGKGTYRYNKPLVIDTNAFNIYRNTFAEFGLGIKTGIDLPNESLGYKGTSVMPGHLLDFSIGQYDTYTPIQISQYVSTLANGGNRMKMNLLKKVYDSDGSLVYEVSPTKLNQVNTKYEYLDRVKWGFRGANVYGTAVGYVDLAYKPASKTGTSQSFIDTNNDGVVDTETISNAFISYAPYDNPKVAFTIISPDVSHNNGYSYYRSTVNKRIAQQVIKKYFYFYK